MQLPHRRRNAVLVVVCRRSCADKLKELTGTGTLTLNGSAASLRLPFTVTFLRLIELFAISKTYSLSLFTAGTGTLTLIAYAAFLRLLLRATPVDWLIYFVPLPFAYRRSTWRIVNISMVLLDMV